MAAFVDKWGRAIAIAIVALHAWFLLGAAAPSTNPLSPLAPQRKGPTFDEYFYIAAGVSYVKTGDFSENREHPPLAKMLSGAPVAMAPGVDFPSAWRDLLHFPVQFFYCHNGADQARNLFLARLPVVLLALLLDAALYRIVGKLGGRWAGLTALGLAAFDPSAIASAATANLDFPNTAFSFFALVAAFRAFEEPGAWRTLLAGAALGAALLTKFTALLLGPAVLLLCAAAAFERKSWRPLGTLGLIALCAFSTFAAGYGFETRSLESVKGHSKYMGRSGAILERSALRAPVEGLFGEKVGVPLLTAVKGLDHTLSETGQIGHRGYLLGESTPMVERTDSDTGRRFGAYVGWKHYYLVVLAQKLPLTTLAMLIVGAVFVAIYSRSWLERAFFLVFPATVLLQFSFSNAQLGIKYVLPALVPLFAAAGMLASRGRFAPWICAVAIVGTLQATIRTHPDEAMFASVLAGGDEHAARIACVGDDWGQDAPGLARFASDLEWVAKANDSGDPIRLRAALDAFRAEHGHELRGKLASGPAPSAPPAADPLVPLAQALRASGVAYRYYGEGEPAAYGYDFDPLPAGPRKGFVAVHATNLYRENQDFSWLERFDPDAVEGERMPGMFGALVRGRWIVSHTPFAKIGRSIYLYAIE